MKASRLSIIAWSLLGLGLAIFALGTWLIGAFSCQVHGPNAFLVSLVACVAAFILFCVHAFQRRTLGTVLVAVASALICAGTLVAGIGLGLRCSGM